MFKRTQQRGLRGLELRVGLLMGKRWADINPISSQDAAGEKIDDNGAAGLFVGPRVCDVEQFLPKRRSIDALVLDCRQRTCGRVFAVKTEKTGDSPCLTGSRKQPGRDSGSNPVGRAERCS